MTAICVLNYHTPEDLYCKKCEIEEKNKQTKTKNKINVIASERLKMDLWSLQMPNFVAFSHGF